MRLFKPLFGQFYYWRSSKPPVHILVLGPFGYFYDVTSHSYFGSTVYETLNRRGYKLKLPFTKLTWTKELRTHGFSHDVATLQIDSAVAEAKRYKKNNFEYKIQFLPVDLEREYQHLIDTAFEDKE